MALQHIRTRKPFFSLSFRKASEDRCRGPRKYRPQGLATLAAVSASPALGSVSQLPTLLGFALQSFAPSPGSEDSFESTLPLRRFLAKPIRASYRRSSGLLPREKPFPDALRRINSKWGPCSPGLYDLLGFLRSLTHAVSLFLTTSPSRS